MELMKIFSWNVNGIRALQKKGELAKFFANYDPDVVCFQEVKARREQFFAEKNLPEKLQEYQVFWNAAERAGYAGTAIFAKKNLSDLAVKNSALNLPARLAKRYNLADDQYGSPNNEGRVLTLEFAKFFLVTVYTPNAKGDLSRLNLRAHGWDPAFRDYLHELDQQKPVIFCGDMNVAHREIDLANPKNNVGKHGFTQEERGGFQRILDAGFLDSFREIHGDIAEKYTWWTHWARARERNVGWRIDYFGVSNSARKNLKNAEIFPEQIGSDHCPVAVEMEF